MEPEPDRIELVDIETEMRAAYLDYAMSVITSRALPDVRDGMKPVQRRILYAMYDAGLRPDRPFRKSATTVGDVLGKYHPHGDSAVYDAMVRLAQGFSMRYPLVDGQGNFGSVDGDPAAAHRYTEARPTVLAMEMLADIDAETVDMRPNFDDSRTEPEVMPARVPNLLVNGASGIAVGMATNIPPHNLGEVCDALVFLLDQRQRAEEVTVEELMRHMPGPDFPTGASILGREGIRNAYATGRGRVVMRATTHIEELRDGRLAIVVDEIPFQVNKATLVERIADLARSKRIDTISDLRDETDRRAMRVVIELRRGADPHVTLNRLLKYSSLQQTFGVNMLALVDGEPRLLPLRKILWHYLEHREDVVRRRSEHQLARARARAHVLEGLLVALANLDAVIETIRRSDDAADARSNLQTRFGLSEIQAQAILDMQLRRLAALERQHIEDEHRELAVRIAELETLLADEERLMAVVRADLLDLKAAYADERRTRIEIDGDEELGDDDLVADQDVLITISERGYIKRVPTETYRSQGRGGRGIRGATTREDDAIRHNVFAGTRDVLLFFSDRGRVYELPAYAVPATGREAAGTPIVNLIQIAPNERVTVALAVPRWQFAHGSYLVMATRRGRVKRTRLSEYTGVRRSGLIGINLEQGDTLCWAKITTGDDDLIMVTRRGLAIRFLESEVRPMGRAASGVRGIRLRSEDEVASLDVVRPQADLLVVTTLGYGKRTPLSSYPRKGRGGLGVRTMDASRLSEVGEIADARVVDDGNEVALVTDLGIVMRTVTDAISRMGRSTRGVRVMRLDAGHRLATMALLADRKPPEGLGDEGGEGTSDPEDDDDGSGLSGDEDEFGVAGDDDVSDGADDGDDPDEDAEDGFGDEPDDDAEDGFGDDPDEDADDDFGDDDPEDDTPEDDPPEEEL